jgi:hypothetical protein
MPVNYTSYRINGTVSQIVTRPFLFVPFVCPSHRHSTPLSILPLLYVKTVEANAAQTRYKRSNVENAGRAGQGLVFSLRSAFCERKRICTIQVDA